MVLKRLGKWASYILLAIGAMACLSWIWYLSPHSFSSRLGMGGDKMTVIDVARGGYIVEQRLIGNNGDILAVRKWTLRKIPLYRRGSLGRTSADEEFYYKNPQKTFWSKAVFRLNSFMVLVIEDTNQDGVPEQCHWKESQLIE